MQTPGLARARRQEVGAHSPLTHLGDVDQAHKEDEDGDGVVDVVDTDVGGLGSVEGEGGGGGRHLTLDWRCEYSNNTSQGLSLLMIIRHKQTEKVKMLSHHQDQHDGGEGSR